MKLSSCVGPAMMAGLIVSLAAVRAASDRVQLVRHDAERRVDVVIDGQPFTSYIWPATLEKPVLYPIRTARGTLVTRGFPLDPRPGERVDHPHHVGLWFNYGDVNGIDFWNNSKDIKPEDRGRMGAVVHRSITHATGGADRGELVARADWVMPDGSVILQQEATYVFAGDASSRTIDLTVTLTAPEKRVSLADNKEGMLGLRVTRALEEPTTKPELFTDAAGRVTTVASLDNTGVNGVYLTSQGRKGGDAWGTRGRWCVLSGAVGPEQVAIAILDHPRNPGHPTYWHARGYGLFAANPLGQKAFSEGKEVLDFAIEPKASATFRYRVLIRSGATSPEDVEGAWREWTAGPTESSLQSHRSRPQ